MSENTAVGVPEMMCMYIQLLYNVHKNILPFDKAKLLQAGNLFLTQFSSLGIFINKKKLKN